MMSQIVSNTPLWVWGIFLGLVWLGTIQLRPRVTSFGRVLGVAFIMSAFSLMGTVSSFGASAGALLAWLGGALAVGWLTSRIALSEDTRYLPERRAFEVPGSWAPLGLMMGVFAVKYVSGVLMGIHAPVTQEPWFAPLLGMVSGEFSGAFIGRAGRLMRLARQSQRLAAGLKA